MVLNEIYALGGMLFTYILVPLCSLPRLEIWEKTKVLKRLRRYHSAFLSFCLCVCVYVRVTFLFVLFGLVCY